MIAAADREELNYLFSESISDADLLRAVEVIESTQMSVGRAPQFDATSDVIETTARTESTGGVEKAAQLQFGKFYTVCTLTIRITASLLISADLRAMKSVRADLGRRSTLFIS